MDGIVIIDKPKGYTSREIVDIVGKNYKTRKVGHTGTLDPLATGVLVICIGKATKVSELILNKDKSYICELTLGITTDTYDSSGEILEKVEDFSFTNEEIEKAFNTQRGHIEQLPPIYSALKVNGKRMCDLVRSGRADEINLKTRPVNIKELNILSIRDNKIMFYVKCSKGTYVRSICYDVGKELGCGGHMSFLLRTSSGKFDLDSAITLEQLEELSQNNLLQNYLYDIDYVLDNLPEVNLKPSAKRYYINGGVIDSKRFIIKGSNKKNIDLVRVYSENNFIGVGKILKDSNTIELKSDKLFI